ncbi:MAG: DNA mismatch repair endonuclease MutL [Spirochaetes bacterium]|nr:DNA mismatch repair endonuclease MutL [Spirochaetota bacterium]
MRIKLLDETTYSKIAAGEVIERPASIVRELIDNAIDSGATEISIKIENSGLEKIIVSDNGCGIEKDDLALALEKHSTSKIDSIDDLEKLVSMGFRGEALHSIKTVSKLALISNTDITGQSSGYQICSFDDQAIQPVATKKGTKVIVEDVFYNIPVRKKFIKSSTSERNLIKKTIIAKSLAYTNIRFSFFQDNKLVLQTPGNDQFEDAFFFLYPKENKFQINHYSLQLSDYAKIDLYYSDYQVFFNNRNYQQIFVNQRPVSINFFYSAIDKGMRSWISPGRFPLIYVFLNIDPSMIDINIHPAKKEIRFFQQNEIYQYLLSTVEKAYSQLAKSDIFQKPEIFSSDHKPFFKKEDPQESETPGRNQRETIWPDFINEYKVTYPQHKEQKDLVSSAAVIDRVDHKALEVNQTYHQYEIIGVIFKTYIIVAEEEGILLLDQHAVSESIIYLNKKEKYELKKSSQPLLIPMVLEVQNWNNSITQKLKILNEHLFEIDQQEGNSLVIRALPSFLTLQKENDQIADIIQNYLELEELFDSQIIDYFLIQASCRKKKKKGDDLNYVEIQELVDHFYKNKMTHCPHGRPVYFRMEKTDLDKLFQRKK